MEKKNKSRLEKSLMLAGTLLLSGIVITYCDRVMKNSKEGSKNFNNLYEEVAQSADTDEDAFTSHKEWSKVYSLLDKNYSVHYSDPKNDLTKEDMDLYLKNN